MRYALLIVAAMLGQVSDPEAEKTYQAMTQKITAAKSLKVVVEMQGTPFGATKTDEPKFKQTLWLGEAGKVRWEFEQPKVGKGEVNGLFVCDGKQSAFRSGATKLDRPTDAAFRSKLGEILAKHGCWVAVAVMNDALDPDGRPFVPLVTSSFKKVGTEKLGGKEVHVVRYLVRERGESPERGGTCTVWIDAKTQLPAKVQLEGASGLRVVETFVEWQLDAQIDAKLFETPK